MARKKTIDTTIYMREYMRRRREALKRKGKCIDCSTRPPEQDRTKCEQCLAKHAGRQVKYLEKRQRTA